MDNGNIFMQGGTPLAESDLAPLPELELEKQTAFEDVDYTAPGQLTNVSPFAQVEVSLGTLANGGVEARFQHALNEVVHNIMDMNTDAKTGREITIKLVFKPSPTRANVELTSSVNTKLAPWQGLDSSVAIGVAKDGSRRSSAIERQVNDV